ncbi:MAG: hypothetical protein ACI87O_001246 [Planctomycetota bacterium]|jgi:hypothetical protein
MNERFECAWRSVGDVARARIQFSDGTSMERTLGGNVITWICDADGAALDVLPGVMDAPTYLKGLQEGSVHVATLELLSHLDRTDFMGPLQRYIALRNRHDSLGWSGYVLDRTSNDLAATRRSESLGVGKLALLRPFPLVSQAATIDAFEVSIAKSSGVEDPIVKTIGRAKPDNFDGPLNEDSWIAQNQLRPQALALMNLELGASVDVLSPHVFRLVLHLDASDPRLGLEKALLGRTDAFIPGAVHRKLGEFTEW